MYAQNVHKKSLLLSFQLLSKMKDEVTCCICLDVWKNPKTLPCDHTMCNDCLAQMQSLSSESSQAVAMISIRCPECRCDHVIEADQWHSSWKTSRQLIVLAKSLTEMKIWLHKIHANVSSSWTCHVIAAWPTWRSLHFHLQDVHVRIYHDVLKKRSNRIKLCK